MMARRTSTPPRAASWLLALVSVLVAACGPGESSPEVEEAEIVEPEPVGPQLALLRPDRTDDEDYELAWFAQVELRMMCLDGECDAHEVTVVSVTSSDPDVVDVIGISDVGVALRTGNEGDATLELRGILDGEELVHDWPVRVRGASVTTSLAPWDPAAFPYRRMWEIWDEPTAVFPGATVQLRADARSLDGEALIGTHLVEWSVTENAALYRQARDTLDRVEVRMPRTPGERVTVMADDRAFEFEVIDPSTIAAIEPVLVGSRGPVWPNGLDELFDSTGSSPAVHVSLIDDQGRVVLGDAPLPLAFADDESTPDTDTTEASVGVEGPNERALAIAGGRGVDVTLRYGSLERSITLLSGGGLVTGWADGVADDVPPPYGTRVARFAYNLTSPSFPPRLVAGHLVRFEASCGECRNQLEASHTSTNPDVLEHRAGNAGLFQPGTSVYARSAGVATIHTSFAGSALGPVGGVPVVVEALGDVTLAFAPECGDPAFTVPLPASATAGPVAVLASESTCASATAVGALGTPATGLALPEWSASGALESEERAAFFVVSDDLVERRVLTAVAGDPGSTLTVQAWDHVVELPVVSADAVAHIDVFASDLGDADGEALGATWSFEERRGYELSVVPRTDAGAAIVSTIGDDWSITFEPPIPDVAIAGRAADDLERIDADDLGGTLTNTITVEFGRLARGSTSTATLRWGALEQSYDVVVE